MKKNECCSTTKPEKSDSCCTGGASCCTTLFKGALVGGLVMFLYFWAACVYLPWHKAAPLSFKNEKAVISAIAKNTEKSGIYMIPQMHAAKEAVAPSVFAAISLKGVNAKTMNDQMYKQLMFCLFAGLLLTLLLKKTNGTTCPGLFSFTAGLAVASFHYLPGMIWLQFPWSYTMYGMIDDVLAVTLAGMFVGRIVLGMELLCFSKCCK